MHTDKLFEEALRLLQTLKLPDYADAKWCVPVHPKWIKRIEKEVKGKYLECEDGSYRFRLNKLPRSGERFEKKYAKDSGTTVEELHKLGRYAIPCDCGDEGCKGWQMGHFKKDAKRLL